MLASLRLPLRTAAFVGTTVGMYGLLEVETALTKRAQHEAVLSKWIGRYGRTLLDIYGVSVIATGAHLERRERYPGTDERGLGRLFVMNHRSALDIALGIALFEATMVSRADLARWPLLGTVARRVGTLFVDRESKRSGASVLRAMDAAVRAGRAVMIFPEGTTFTGDEVRPFKAGAFQTAQRTGAEVVPVGLAYDRNEVAFLDEGFATHLRRVSGVPHTRASLMVGEPLRPTAQPTELQRRAHEAVQALVHRARAALTTTSSRPT
jgi:1-acyl-sn-glycerol-3-phosphate acyltransferase